MIVKHALGIPELTKMVAKGRKLVTYFHQSSSVNDLLMAKQALLLSEELRGHKLIMDCPTRWNSTHAMLERLLEQTPTIMAVISDPECSKAAANTLKNYVYSFEELDLVERVAYVLAPFLKATNSLCADKSPSMQKVIPVVIKLAQLVEINEDDPHQIKQLKGRMGSEIESRTRDKELAVMACVLNPFTKSLDFLSVNERLEGHQLLLKAALGLESKPVLKVKEEPGIVGPQNGSLPPLPVVPDLLKNDTISSEVQRPDLPTLPSLDPLPSQKSEEDVKVLYVRESEPKKPKLHDMDEWLQDVICIGESSKPVSDVIEQEVARYLGASQTDTDLTILQWWKKNGPFYPRLSCLAKKFLAIPASSVSSERVFSLAGHLVSKKRARLSSANIDNMIFLNKNMEYYW